jgi:hypothetical protein
MGKKYKQDIVHNDSIRHYFVEDDKKADKAGGEQHESFIFITTALVVQI